MTKGRLVIGTKRYSSWSLRGWLAVQLAHLDVEEVVIPLAGGGTYLDRTTLTPLADGRVHQRIEVSGDGVAWRTVFDAIYVRADGTAAGVGAAAR